MILPSEKEGREARARRQRRGQEHPIIRALAWGFWVAVGVVVAAVCAWLVVWIVRQIGALL